jgi:hypothetical protein
LARAASERGILATLPAFWPTAGLVLAARSAAAVVLRDDLPLEAAPASHRARLSTDAGDVWLTLPIRAATPGTPLCAIRLAPTASFAPRAMRAIEHAFADAPFFEHYRCDVARLLFREWTALVPLAAAMTQLALSANGLRASVLLASELVAGIPGDARPILHRSVSDGSALERLFRHGPTEIGPGRSARRTAPPRRRVEAPILHFPMQGAR